MSNKCLAFTSMFAEQEIISFEIVDGGFDRQSGQTRDY